MRIDIAKLEAAGIAVDVYDNTIEIEIKENSNPTVFNGFLKLLDNTDLSHSNALRLAEDFAIKTANAYIFQEIERCN